MAKYYLGNNDLMFKAIFCDEANKMLLSKLLESILNQEVEIIEIKNGELPVSNVNVKKQMLDLLCIVDKKYVHIELNLNPGEYIRFRNFAYFTEVINNSVRPGKKYDDTKEYIHIDLTYKNNLGDEDVYTYYMQDLTGRKYVDNVTILEYNMNKITDYFKKNDIDNIEKYKYLIMLGLNPDEIDEMPIKDEIIEQYETLLETKNGDVYFMSLLTAEEEFQMINNTERYLGEEAGRKAGIEQGKKEGIEQGIEQGKKEILNNLSKIKTMLNNNKTKEEIVKTLNISMNDLNTIIKILN